jgi:hypothetical protein
MLFKNAKQHNAQTRHLAVQLKIKTTVRGSDKPPFHDIQGRKPLEAWTWHPPIRLEIKQHLTRHLLITPSNALKGKQQSEAQTRHLPLQFKIIHNSHICLKQLEALTSPHFLMIPFNAVQGFKTAQGSNLAPSSTTQDKCNGWMLLPASSQC